MFIVKQFKLDNNHKDLNCKKEFRKHDLPV